MTRPHTQPDRPGAGRSDPYSEWVGPYTEQYLFWDFLLRGLIPCNPGKEVRSAPALAPSQMQPRADNNHRTHSAPKEENYADDLFLQSRLTAFTMSYDDKTVLARTSFTIPRGSVLALLGPTAQARARLSISCASPRSSGYVCPGG